MIETLSKTFIGIDPSLTRTAVCVLRLGHLSNQFTHETFIFGSKPASSLLGRISRYNELISQVWFEVCQAKPSVIAIEGYSYASQGRGHLDLVEYGGLLRAELCCASDCLVFEVPPTSLKKFVLGKGVGDKTLMALGVFKRWGVEFPTNDETDAYALARVAACLGGTSTPENESQRAVIDSILGQKKEKKPKKKVRV